MSSSDLDDDPVIRSIHDLYNSLNFTPPHSQFTILASFYLLFSPTSSLPAECLNGRPKQYKIISLATGTKCTPESRLSARGELVHDSHAEVLARRGAARWLVEEAHRVLLTHPGTRNGEDNVYLSPWHEFSESTGKFRLREGVKLCLYVSTLPCGDASTRYLALFQDAAMAALKDGPTLSCPSVSSPTPASTSASRGRDGYSLLGILRSKPGRSDSPKTLCMSCSDKIARWNVLGIQGALGSLLFEPTYLDEVVVGEVPQDLEGLVKEDCERALWRRLEEDSRWQTHVEGLPEGYRLAEPQIRFTSLPFVHSKAVLQTDASSCNEAISWIAETGHEILINGLKRGVSPKHRFREKSRSKLCRLSMYELCAQVLGLQGREDLEPKELPYLEAKALAGEYQIAKEALLGPQGPFVGWIRTGSQYQVFDRTGHVA
ncbi:adenosine deaminase/editase [Coprinopsis sp. MPI-PUGE-AT-0042]|nr:adenosine deaminase/editase [Coprinopsis sp. MPI-PUGE-AT-0042]